MRNIEVYEDLTKIIGEIEFDVELLQMMVLNGNHARGNQYLMEAIVELKHALSDLSDAEFDITVSRDDEWV